MTSSFQRCLVSAHQAERSSFNADGERRWPRAFPRTGSVQNAGRDLTRFPWCVLAWVRQKPADDVVGDLRDGLVDEDTTWPRDRARRKDLAAAGRVVVDHVGPPIVAIHALGKKVDVLGRAGCDLVGFVTRGAPLAPPVQALLAKYASVAQ